MDEVLGEEAPLEEPEAEPEPKERSAILGEVRVKLRALSKIYNWDGQTVLFAQGLF
jgi:hypothetical protein